MKNNPKQRDQKNKEETAAADLSQSEASSRGGSRRRSKQAQKSDVPRSDADLPQTQCQVSQHQQALLKANIAGRRQTKKLNLRSSIRLSHTDPETSQVSNNEPMEDKCRDVNNAGQKLSLHINQRPAQTPIQTINPVPQGVKRVRNATKVIQMELPQKRPRRDHSHEIENKSQDSGVHAKAKVVSVVQVPLNQEQRVLSRVENLPDSYPMDPICLAQQSGSFKTKQNHIQNQTKSANGIDSLGMVRKAAVLSGDEAARIACQEKTGRNVICAPALISTANLDLNQKGVPTQESSKVSGPKTEQVTSLQNQINRIVSTVPISNRNSNTIGVKAVRDSQQVSVAHNAHQHEVQGQVRHAHLGANNMVQDTQAALKIADQESLRDEEEAELKLLVKNVPKKLTYDQNDQIMLNLQGIGSCGQGLNYRNDEAQHASGNQADREEGESAVLEEGEDDVEKRDVYYELSSSNNDVTESEEEEDDHLMCIKIEGNEVQPEVKAEIQEFETKLAENSNFLQQTPARDDFETSKQQQIIRRQKDNPNIYKTGPTKYQDGANKGHWTREEDEQLTIAVSKFRSRNWKKIAECLEGRTDVQCLHRWQKVLNPDLVKGPWSIEEDALVLRLVQEKGAQKWTTIAEHLPGRIGKQCRERWHNHLNPKIKKNTWSLEEELILYISHKGQGNKWADIAQILEGRTDNTIKNHWNSSMKKKITDMLFEIEHRFKKKCDEIKVKYVGCPLDSTQTFTNTYKEVYYKFEKNLLDNLISTVKVQNQVYFQQRARDLLLEKDPDGINLQTAKMLLKDLGLNIHDILPGQRHVAPSPIPSNHRNATTASRTGLGSTQSFRRRDGDAGHDVTITHFNPMPNNKQGFIIQSTQQQKQPTIFRKRSTGSKSSKGSRANSTKQYVYTKLSNVEAIQDIKKAEQEKKRGPSSGRGRGRPPRSDRSHPKPKILQEQGTETQVHVVQQPTIVRTTVIPRSPGPNTPEFERYYVSERSIHKPLQSNAWTGIQIGQDFQERKLGQGGNSSKTVPMINLQVIDPPNGNQPILNCFDYEHFKNITDDHTPTNEQSFQNQQPTYLHQQFSFGGPGQISSTQALSSIQLQQQNSSGQSQKFGGGFSTALEHSPNTPKNGMHELHEYNPHSVIHRMQINNQLNSQKNQQPFDSTKHQYAQGGPFAMPSLPLRLSAVPSSHNSAQKFYLKDFNPDIMYRMSSRVQESPGFYEFLSKQRRSPPEMMRGNSNYKMNPDISPHCDNKPTKTTGVGSSSAFKPYGNSSCSPAQQGYTLHSTHPFYIGENNEEVYTHDRETQSVQPFQLHNTLQNCNSGEQKLNTQINQNSVVQNQLKQSLKKQMVNQYQNQISSIQSLFPSNFRQQLKEVDAGEYAAQIRHGQLNISKPRGALSSLSQGQISSLTNQASKNVAALGSANPLSNKFVIKESENNINVALAHLNLPNAQHAFQQPAVLQVQQQKTATLGEADDVEMKQTKESKTKQIAEENESPAKKTVCKFISNSCSKKSKGSPSDCESLRS